MKNAQHETSTRAQKMGAKVNSFFGWRITDKDGNEYYADKIADVYAILAELENQSHEQTTR